MPTDFSKALPEEERGEVVLFKGYELDLEKAKADFGDYVEEVDSLVKKAEVLKIENEDQNQLAVAMGTSAKKLTKQIEARRNEIIKLPDNYVKGIRNFCKMFTEKLISIEMTLKDKITSYRIIQEQKRREAELKAQKETEKLQTKLDKDAAKKGIEPPQILAPILPKGAPVVRTESGSASGRKHWTWILEDQDKVSREYLTLDEKKVNDFVRGGGRNLPGIKIFEKETTSFRVA